MNQNANGFRAIYEIIGLIILFRLSKTLTKIKIFNFCNLMKLDSEGNPTIEPIAPALTSTISTSSSSTTIVSILNTTTSTTTFINIPINTTESGFVFDFCEIKPCLNNG